MTLAEWRTKPDLIAQAAEWLVQPMTLLVMATLDESSPARYATPVKGFSDIDCAKWLGQIEGYQLCLNQMRQLAIAITAKKEVEATFTETQFGPKP